MCGEDGFSPGCCGADARMLRAGTFLMVANLCIFLFSPSSPRPNKRAPKPSSAACQHHVCMREQGSPPKPSSAPLSRSLYLSLSERIKSSLNDSRDCLSDWELSGKCILHFPPATRAPCTTALPSPRPACVLSGQGPNRAPG